jgi:hypothetical protein
MKGAADRLHWPVLGLATALYLVWGLAPRAPIFTSVFTAARLLALASLFKLAFLLAGTLWAWRCRGVLEAGNPVRPAWALLAGGVGATFVGQAFLAPYQILSGKTPFPTVADVFYVGAYPLLALGLAWFAVAYGRAGFPVGSAGERTALLAVVAAGCLALAVPVLRPVIAANMAPLDKALSVAYPALDLVLVVPLALLLRITLRFRGGDLGTAWLVVLSGFVVLCAADVLFAYFTALGQEGLDPFVHAAYIVSYGLIAGGIRRHLRLLAA